MTSRLSRDRQDQRELLRSSQLERIENLLGMLELTPRNYSGPMDWDRYCENMGLPKGSYPEGAYTVAYESFPGLGVLLYIPPEGLVEWLSTIVPMTDDERALFLSRQTLKLMGE